MNTKLKIVPLLALVFSVLFTTQFAEAQSSSYVLLPESTMQIKGTSTLHDWTADVQEMNLNVNVDADLIQEEAFPGSGDFIRSLSLSIPVQKIKSGKGKMDKKMYDALKEEKHPNVRYELTGLELVSNDTTGGGFTLNTTGKLTIADSTRSVSFLVEGQKMENTGLNFSGNYTLNMKDYGIDPPSAVFGTIKSGEMVDIVFDLTLGKK